MTRIASIEEALEAFTNLSNRELIALRRFARSRIGGTCYTEPADLLHEALHRCLQGERRWPLTVRFIAFLANAMKSIASADRVSSGARLNVSLDAGESDLHDCHSSHGAARHSTLGPSPEESTIAAERARFARARAEELEGAFKTDPIARAVVAGWLAELDPNEVMSAHQISAKDYKAARERVSRKAAKVARRYQ